MPRLPSTTICFALASILFSALARADNPISPTFPYGEEKVRGVNIGGWLVLEPWVTPSLFEKTGNVNIVDEWTFGELQDKSVAEAALKDHWDTFYSEDDFKEIAAAGINHVRIPIGYWAFQPSPDEPYISGQLPYLQKAIGWAGKHGLKVIVDFHGAPGSQNGYDNSGHKMTTPTWASNSTNVARTNSVLKEIAEMFTPQVEVASIIAPLNEPAGYFSDQVLEVAKQYWLDSYEAIRTQNGSETNTVVLIHDAFQNSSYWSDFMTSSEYQGVVLDTHIYQVFSDEKVNMTTNEHLQLACNQTEILESYELDVVVGEWCPAITDCAKYLNGRGVGARFDGTYPNSTYVGDCSLYTGSGASFSGDYKEFLRKFWEVQADAYETRYGWVQWLWKTEEGTGEEWSYKAGLEYGWIPQDPTERKYPGLCDSLQASISLNINASINM